MTTLQVRASVCHGLGSVPAGLMEALGTFVRAQQRSLEVPVTSVRFDLACRAARGATPHTVGPCLREMGIEPLHSPRQRPYDLDVELHPLLYEWYFTPKSARSMADFGVTHGSVLALGAPSVAHEVAQAGHPVTLIDLDPNTSERFPGLRLPHAHTVVGDITKTGFGLGLFDTVVLDPPWYLNDYLSWLEVAIQHVDEGGRVVFPLLREYVRPGAISDRQTILDVASGMGRVELRQAEAVYSTPRFEAESLRAAGLPYPGDWRAADVIVLSRNETVRHFRHLGTAQGPQGQSDSESWDWFRIGHRMIALRKDMATCEGWVLKSIPGCPANILPSVSRRDERRSLVGLWTSGHRVLSVGQHGLVARWLTLLSRDEPLPAPGSEDIRIAQELLLSVVFEKFSKREED